MNYVADTHALLWYFFAPGRLGAAAASALVAAHLGSVQISVPAIVLSEMIMAVEKNRLPGVTMPKLLAEFNRMQGSASYIFLPLTPALVIQSHKNTVIPDIFDRLIATEAQLQGCPLITRDPVIINSGLVTTIWD